MRYKRSIYNSKDNIPEVENYVKEECAEYMTNSRPKTFSSKNCAKAIEWAKINRTLKARFGNVDEEKILEEMDEEINNSNVEYLDGAEVFAKIRRMIDEW